MTDPHPATLPAVEAQVLAPATSIWNTQAPPPSSGQTRSDSRNWVGAQVISIDKRTDAGADISAGLAQINAGDTLRLEHATEPSRFAYYGVSAAPTQVVDHFQFPVTYKSGGGTLPNSGTRILLTFVTNPPSALALNWLIEPARAQNRFWIVCYCGHGQVVETVAMFPGGPPVGHGIIETTAQNLIRKTGCDCHIMTPGDGAVKLLLLGAGTTMSTRDVENGYAAAFRELGVDLHLYALEARLPLARQWLMAQWRKRGRIEDERPTWADVFYRASIEALEMALRFEVDWVFVISAMFVHPDALILMRRAGLRVAVLFTESPYEDLPQLRVSQVVDWCWTNERRSVRTLRGGYLAHAYDPARHTVTAEIDTEVPAHDVVFVGTGFIERIRLLQEVDWTGIDLGLYGEWGLLGSRSKLRQYVRAPYIENDSTIALYRRAKVGLNLFRSSAAYGRTKTWHYSRAQSANPRTFELAGCGLFQLSEYRREVEDVFGPSVPTFRDAAQLQRLLGHALDDPDYRTNLAAQAHDRVAPHTYAARAAQALADLEQLESVQAKGA